MEVGNYIFYSCIGKAYNGFADVCLSKKKNSPELFATRIYALDDAAVDPDELKRELAIMRQLSHNNILRIVESFTIDCRLFIVTQLMNYGSVADLLRFRFAFGLPEPMIAFIIQELLKAIRYLHDHEVVHRSIRCSHVLLSSDRSVKLSGFRWATSCLQNGRRMKPLYEFLPTFKPNLLWLAPEVLQQNLTGYGTKSDIYSLGICGCEMANGFAPFSDMDYVQMFVEKLRGTTPRLLDETTLGAAVTDEACAVNDEQRNRRFSDKFHHFIEQCLKFNPHERPAAADLLKHPFMKFPKKRLLLESYWSSIRPLSLSGGASAETSVSLLSPCVEKLFVPSAMDTTKEIRWSFEP